MTDEVRDVSETADAKQTPEAAAPAEPAAAEAPTEVPPVAEPTAEPTAEPAAAPAPEADAADGPAGKIKIGSQRDAKPAAKAKPQSLDKGANVAAAQAEAPKPKQKTDVPNIRRELSDELQAEYEAALAGGELGGELGDMLGVTKGVAEQLEEGSEQTGRVLSMRSESVFVDLGGRNQGVVSSRQLKEAPEVGQELTVRVSSYNIEDGLYELVVPGAAIDHADWSVMTEGALVDAVVTGHNKGGLEVEVNKIRGFIPISQVALFRIDDLEQFVGQKFTCVATEVKPEKKNLVLSRRAILEREREENREKLLAELQVGQIREGVVRKLEKFGAFVDIGGIDGLVHISQLSWDHVRHPSDVLEVGQQIRVRVEKVDAAAGKIGLGYRDLFESPWVKAVENYPAHSKVKGTVSKTADFGAFVKLEPGIEGLVHISEIAHHRVNRVTDYLKEGQEVEAMVLAVDPDKQRMSLSMKALEARAEPKKKEEEELPELPESTAPKTDPANLKGGFDRPTGGEEFGLKW